MPMELPETWFEAPKRPTNPDDEVHNIVVPHVKAICSDQNQIFLQNRLNSQLYSNREPMLFDWWSDISFDFEPLDTNLENVLQSTVDTLESVVAKYQYKATPTPRGAAFDAYLRARQLDRYLYAMFLEQKVYDVMPRQFIDGLVFGTGAVKIDLDGGDIFTERVHIHEIVVDQRQCLSSTEPQEMFQVKLVPRLSLLRKYGKRSSALKEKIMSAPGQTFMYSNSGSKAQEMVPVIQGWKLPSDGEEGREVIVIETATLKDVPYTRERFPFVFFRAKNPLSGGFYGPSLVEDLTGYQIRLNEMNDKIRMGHELMIVPRLFLDVNQEILASQFDNELGKIYKGRFNGVPPVPMTWPAFNPEIYNERDRMGTKAMNFAGVTEMSAQGKLPPGTRLDSGEAINEAAGREESRFARIAQLYEALTPQYASHYVELLAKLPKDSKRRTKFYRTRYMASPIDFDEAWADFDSYQLTVEVSSITGMTPSARKQVLDEWSAKGKIGLDQYKGLSGNPDLEHQVDLMNAATDHGEFMVDNMLRGEAQTPDPNDNLARVTQLVLDTYLHLRCLRPEAGEKKRYETSLQLFRNFLQMCKNQLQPPAPPVDPMSGGGMGGAPPVDPMTGMPLDPMMAAAPPGMSMPGVPPGPPQGAPPPGMSYPAAQGIM